MFRNARLDLMRRSRLAITSVSLFLGCFTSHLGRAQEIEVLELPLEELLETEVRVGSLLGGGVQASPATVIVIPERDIETSTASNLTELLQMKVPGADARTNVFVNPMWGFRGIITDRPENVLLNVDGEMQNLMGRDGVVGESVLGLMDDIQEVQVTVGPGSVVHGMGAIAGAVNLKLKDGRDEKPIQTNVAYGTHGDVSGEVARAVKWDEGKQALRISGGYRRDIEPNGKYGGIRTGLGGFEVNEPNHFHPGRRFEDHYRFTSVYTHEPAKVTAFVRYFDVSWDPGYLSRSLTATGFTLAREFFHRNLSLSGSKRLTLAENLELKFTVGYTTAANGFRRSTDNALNNGIITNRGDILESLAETRYRFRTEIEANSSGWHPYALGGEYRLDDLGHSPLGAHEVHLTEFPANVTGGKPYTPVRYNNASLFGEYQYARFHWLRPVVGSRLDVHTHALTVSPRVALLSSSSDRIHHGRIVAQSAYRNNSADIYETDRFDTAASFRGPTYSVPPARNHSVELGYHFAQDPWKASLSLHRNYLLLWTWDDIQKAKVDTKATTQGFEVEGERRIGRLTLGLSHAHAGLVNAPSKPSHISQDNEHLLNFIEDISRLFAQLDLSPWTFTLNSRYEWGFPGRRLAADWKQQNVPAAVENLHWITSRGWKLDLHIEREVATGRIGAELRHIAGLWSEENQLEHTFDAQSSPVSVQDEAQAWNIDRFQVRIFYRMGI